jgi:hypothetical protein
MDMAWEWAKPSKHAVVPTFHLTQSFCRGHIVSMFLRCKTRRKDGKTHRYWRVVENCRRKGGGIVQRHVLYLGEINDAQRAAWCKTIDVLEGSGSETRQIAIFPEDQLTELGRSGQL